MAGASVPTSNPPGAEPTVIVSFWRMAMRTAWISGGFTIFVIFLLGVSHYLAGPVDPANSPRWQKLRTELAAKPTDAKLQEEFRRVDWEVRQKYFYFQRIAQMGTWLALIGAAIAVAAWNIANELRRRIFLPVPNSRAVNESHSQQSVAILSVAGLGVTLALAAILITFAYRPPVDWKQFHDSSASVGIAAASRDVPGGSRVPPSSSEGMTASRPSGAIESAPEKAPLSSEQERGMPGGLSPQVTSGTAEGAGGVLSPSERVSQGAGGIPSGASPKPAGGTAGFTAENRPVKFTVEPSVFRRHWHRFRGPEGSGISAFDSAPIEWDVTTGKGVRWKVPVPLPGNSSPVVWGARIFLSGATETIRHVYCFSTEDGSLLWQTEVPTKAESPFDPKKVAHETGFASPTPTTDGRRVFAMFATGDVAAMDFDGRLSWVRNLGIPDSAYGYAASLEIFGDRLIIQFDQGSQAKEGKSRLIALDVESGESIYEVSRPVPNSWSSPAVVELAGRFQLLTCGAPWVISYDPASGLEIWRAKCLEGDVGPSPVVADGVVYAGNEYSVWSAIRGDGQGDVTSTHILWQAEENLPDLCSPLATSEFVFLLASWGILTCYDAKSGEKLWELDLKASFISSPGMAGNRVYVIGEKEEEQPDGKFETFGYCWVIEPTREGGKILACNPLGEGCTASPAFQENRIYIRGRKHLICVGN